MKYKNIQQETEIKTPYHTAIKRMKKPKKEKHNRQIIKDLQKWYEVSN